MFVPAACTDSSGLPRAHGEVWKASKDACCMYRCDNDTVLPVEYDCSSVAVPKCRRAGEVIISLADDASCCPQKVCGEIMRVPERSTCFETCLLKSNANV